MWTGTSSASMTIGVLRPLGDEPDVREAISLG
jgi:hypothetical protein